MRAELHQKLTEALGSRYCYYQPPTNIKMEYPCIVYKLGGDSVRHADNWAYGRAKQYTVTVIDKNPDSEIPDRIAALPYCRLSRSYTAENLHHWAFTIYHR